MDAEPQLRCPACGSEEVEVQAGRASACTPMPPIEALRCRQCGNTGSRIRLGRETRTRWDRAGSPA